MTAPATEVWTTRRLLAWMQQAFHQRGLDGPRLLAEMLLAHVLGCDRLKLYLDPDRPASPLERQTLRDMAGRALKHEPVQYLVGESWFFGLPFHVDKRVLIPRPATETIVEHVLQHARNTPGFATPASGGEGLLIADVCTGSGCVAISLLKNLPKARAAASDLCADALAVARQNAQRHSVSDRLDLLEGDLLQPIVEYPGSRHAGGVSYLVSNPPYIPDDEWGAVEPNVKDHEPHKALRGGVDGLDFVRRLLVDGPTLLRSGGLMLIEVADSRAEQAAELMRGVAGMTETQIVRDVDGLPRVIVARKV